MVVVVTVGGIWEDHGGDGRGNEEGSRKTKKRKSAKNDDVMSAATAATTLTLSDIADQRRSSDGEFLSLPLMLSKMPAGMLSTLIEYLQTTFDAKISRLRLASPASSITSSASEGMNGMGISDFLEGFISDILDLSSTPTSSRMTTIDDEEPAFERRGVNNNDDEEQSEARPSAKRKRKREMKLVKEILGDVHFTLSFAPMLKSLDVGIPRDDLDMFLARGKLGGREDGPLSTSATQRAHSRHASSSTLLTGALFEYLSQHLALDPTMTLPVPVIPPPSTPEDVPGAAASATNAGSPDPATATTAAPSVNPDKAPSAPQSQPPPPAPPAPTTRGPKSRESNKAASWGGGGGKESKLTITMSKIATTAFVVWGDGRVRVNTPFQYLVAGPDADGDVNMEVTDDGDGMDGADEVGDGGGEGVEESLVRQLSAAHVRAANGLLGRLMGRARGGSW